MQPPLRGLADPLGDTKPGSWEHKGAAASFCGPPTLLDVRISHPCGSSEGQQRIFMSKLMGEPYGYPPSLPVGSWLHWGKFSLSHCFWNATEGTRGHHTGHAGSGFCSGHHPCQILFCRRGNSSLSPDPTAHPHRGAGSQSQCLGAVGFVGFCGFLWVFAAPWQSPPGTA